MLGPRSVPLHGFMPQQEAPSARALRPGPPYRWPARSADDSTGAAGIRFQVRTRVMLMDVDILVSSRSCRNCSRDWASRAMNWPSLSNAAPSFRSVSRRLVYRSVDECVARPAVLHPMIAVHNVRAVH